MARRDDIVEFARELLDLDSFHDYGPMGMQVVGADEVTKLAATVSSTLEAFQRTKEAGAQLLLVHHGLFWEGDPRIVDSHMRARLRTLFEGDITLAAYHLALDAHPEIGNNAIVARELGIDEPIDLVDVFRRTEHTPQHAQEAVDTGAKALWLQLGIRSDESRRIATEAGIDYVEDLCTAVVHRNLG